MADAMISLGAKLRQVGQSMPEAPAVSCRDETISYNALNRQSNRLAHGLQSYGVKSGDLVTLALQNGIGFVTACWAIWKLGATPQPISSRLAPKELNVILDLAKPTAVITDLPYQIERPTLTLSDILALSTSDVDLEDRVPQISRAITSGGSTGRPKLILGGQPAMYAEISPDQSMWGMKPGTASILPTPLYHTAGFAMMIESVCVGAHLVLSPRFDPETVLRQICQFHAHWIFLVPTMMSRIWRLPDDVKFCYDLSSLKVLWHLAAPCPQWLKEAFINWVGADVVMERYGGAESQAISQISGAEWLTRRGSVGRVWVGEMKIFDEDGIELPPGRTGEIYLRRPQGAPVTYTYVGADARTLPGGWDSLGDMGWFDEDGYLYLADRRTDMILVGGANVYPAEIESALEEHPAVQSCAVIGLPNEDLGNLIHAIVQLRDALPENELREHLAERLVSYKRPRSFEFVTDPLRDDAGKVRRTALRDERIAHGQSGGTAAK